jgi:alkanesulfonate monooxygenase SsuD/methylene tetrahydromethanopterin reductase-like flavin-dependent oxidoreductase (luciferase family)
MARTADQSDLIDSIWVGDNLLSKPRVDSIVVLSALSVVTSQVRLGTICYASFPFRHPLTVAIQWASLDVLSGGRTVFGVCAGGAAELGPHFAAELREMAVPSNERVPRLVEGIKLLRLFWGPEPVAYQGRFYQFENVNPVPKPVQKKVPILYAVVPSPALGSQNEERALRRVARLADGWQVDGGTIALSRFAEYWRRIREYAEEYGRLDEVTESCSHIMVNINDDAAAARQESAEYLAKYYGQGRVTPEKLELWLAGGPPSAVIDKIARVIEAGCTTPVLRFTAMEPHAQLERFLAEVLPAFRDQMASMKAPVGAA